MTAPEIDVKGLVERLERQARWCRERGQHGNADAWEGSAQTVLSLERDLAAAREALRPFADTPPADFTKDADYCERWFTAAELRKAAEVYAAPTHVPVEFDEAMPPADATLKGCGSIDCVQACAAPPGECDFERTLPPADAKGEG